MRMADSRRGSLHLEGVAALTHMEQALELLDTIDLTTEVGGHLDLAICRLRDALESSSNGRAPTSDDEASD